MAQGRASIPFFVMHYGIFWFVHGVFVLTLPLFWVAGAETGRSTSTPASDPARDRRRGRSALVISHGVSYRFNFIGDGEYLRSSPAAQMFAPYGRLVVLHVTIIVGGMAIAFTGAPAAAIVDPRAAQDRAGPRLPPARAPRAWRPRASATTE